MTQKQLCFWQSEERAPSRGKGEGSAGEQGPCSRCFLKTDGQDLPETRGPSQSETAFLWLKITELENLPGDALENKLATLPLYPQPPSRQARVSMTKKPACDLPIQ